MNTCATCAHATEEGDQYRFAIPVGPDAEQATEAGLWCTLRPRWDQVTARHWCNAWSPA